MKALLRLVVSGRQIVDAINQLTSEVRALRLALVPELPEVTDERDVRLVKTIYNNGSSSKQMTRDEWSRGILEEYSPRSNYARRDDER